MFGVIKGLADKGQIKSIIVSNWIKKDLRMNLPV